MFPPTGFLVIHLVIIGSYLRLDADSSLLQRPQAAVIKNIAQQARNMAISPRKTQSIFIMHSCC